MERKPRLVQIKDLETYAELDRRKGYLDVPNIIVRIDCGVVTTWVDADEYRAWRALQSTSLGDE